jgi:NADH:ubiquinone oxidoreductase subunit E
MDVDGVLSIVQKHSGQRGAMISILEEVQEKYGYLTADALRTVAEATGRPLVDVYGLATFYRFFRLKPRGKHLCSVCLGTACHVRGAPRVLEAVQAQLGIDPGDTTADEEFTLETVNCLGACALGPVVVMDGRYSSGVNPTKVGRIIEKAREGIDRTEGKDLIFPVSVNCSRCNHSLMDGEHQVDDCPSIRVAVSSGDAHGWLRLSSLYGSDSRESEPAFAADTVLGFFCPQCHSELRGPLECPECGASMATMIVREGGVLHVCMRRGCTGRMLDLF